MLTPIGVDADRGWILLPDGGPPLGPEFVRVRDAYLEIFGDLGSPAEFVEALGSLLDDSYLVSA